MTKGFFTFIHHDFPIEYSEDIGKRLRYIDMDKPAHERAERKRCIVAVPEDLLPTEYLEAWRAIDTVAFAHIEEDCKEALLDIALSLIPDAPWDKELGKLVFDRKE